MSLHALANHMATKGRGGDSMLVHMTPGEVQALQALAKRNGGTLTINPETGQPEANFLKKLLPAIAGAALNFFVPGLGAAVGGAFGLGAAAGTGIAVGGLTSLATGSLSRGLMAGMGAYGGASLVGGVANAGTGALSAEAGNAAVSQAGLTGAEALSPAADQIAQNAIGSRLAAATPSETLSAGFKAVTDSPAAMGNFAKSNAQAGLAAMSPMMADQGVQTTTKRPDTGYIRNFTFDPYGQTYSDAGSYPASEYKGMAQGGIVALAEGGGLTLPEGWGVAGGKYDDPSEKIAYFNQQNITPTQLQSYVNPQGVKESLSQADIDWMKTQGYNPNIGSYLSSNPNATYQDISSNITQLGLTQEQATKAMQDAGLSGAVQYAAFNPDIGSAANESETYGGLKGLSSNINYWLNTHPGASLDEFRGEMSKWLLNEDDIRRATGRTSADLFTGPITTVYNPAEGASGSTGAGAVGGGTVVNPNGTITTSPRIPGIPVGGFTGMEQVRDAYTAGGGSLGYVNNAPKTMEEFDTRFNKQTGDSLAAYNYLMGKGANPVKSGVGEIMRPYNEAVRGIPAREGRPTQRYIYDPINRVYVENPNYVPFSYDEKGKRNIGLADNEVLKGFQALPPKSDDAAIFDWVSKNNVTLAQLAKVMKIPLAEAQRRKDAAAKTKADAAKVKEDIPQAANGGVMGMALGGLGALAGGGQAGYNLGGYSDGGRLLKGPGDGVSDSIPATIGDKQPARLADGEFVVPARIVSELGNGSTEAGARKLYAMMDRVQKARGKTTGKNRVAANTRSEKYLPA
jgi:hypothetical protein